MSTDRCDRADDADGLLDDDEAPRLDRRADHVAVQPLGLLGEPLEVADARVHLAQRVGQHLSLDREISVLHM